MLFIRKIFDKLEKRDYAEQKRHSAKVLLTNVKPNYKLFNISWNDVTFLTEEKTIVHNAVCIHNNPTSLPSYTSDKTTVEVKYNESHHDKYYRNYTIVDCDLNIDKVPESRYDENIRVHYQVTGETAAENHIFYIESIFGDVEEIRKKFKNNSKFVITKLENNPPYLNVYEIEGVGYGFRSKSCKH